MGKKTVFAGQEQASSRLVIDELVRTATGLAAKKIGALIVIERNIILSRYVDIGILVDAKVSKELLISIFHPTSPIHDGAVIIQQGRLAAAGCFLPLTRDEGIDPNYGTRHRAAIGISQETDAIALVISEETSAISLMVDGLILRNVDAKELRKALRQLLAADTSESTKQIKNGKLGIWDKLKQLRSRGEP
jgi:diadenylate cyclase